MKTIRISFLVIFSLVSVAGAGQRSEALAGLTALLLAAVVVLLEIHFSRLFAAHLSSIVYGALMGWIVGLVFLWAAKALPVVRMAMEPAFEAALTVAFMYVGAVGAIRAAAAGRVAVRVRVKKRPKAVPEPSASAAVWWLRIVFAMAGVACIAPLLHGSHVDRTAVWCVAVVLLAFAGWCVDRIAGRRLPAVVPIVLPAVFFAIAAAGETFVLVSLSAVLNYYVSLEAQQIALFLVWLYIGVAFMLRAKLTGNYVVPLVTFEERDDG